MAGLLGDTDWTDPANQGLLQFGLSLLAGSGPSRQRTSVGQLIGLAGGQGMDAFNVARRQKLLEQESRRRDELAQAQLQQILAAAAKQKEQEQRAAAGEQATMDYLRSLQTPQYAPGTGALRPELTPGPTMPKHDPVRAALSGVPLQGIAAIETLLKEKAPKITKPGDIARDESGNIVWQNPAEDKPTDLARMVREAQALPADSPLRAIYQDAIRKATTHQPGVNVSYGAPVAGVDDSGRPVFFQPDKGGGKPAIIPGVAPPKSVTEPKPMTDTQANANLYSTRMSEADSILRNLEGKYNVNWLFARQQAGDGTVGAIANSRLTPEAQSADQAQRDFINAVLRRESGAVISPSEFSNARQQYFTQPGDSPAVILQKEKNRRTAIEGIRAASGPAGERERQKVPSGAARITSDAEFEALPSGTLFTGPDGVLRRKP